MICDVRQMTPDTPCPAYPLQHGFVTASAHIRKPRTLGNYLRSFPCVLRMFMPVLGSASSALRCAFRAVTAVRFVTVPACVRCAGPLRSPYPLATVVHICPAACPRSCLVHARSGFLCLCGFITPAVVVWSGQSSPLTHPKP